MMDKTKAVTPAGTGMTVAHSTGDQAVTERYSILPDGARERKGIFRFIPEGRENAIHLRDLVQLTGLHERDARRAIERARVAGEFILSDDRGYWRADPRTEEGAAEIMRFYRREACRIRALARRLEPVRRRVEAARAVGTDQVTMEGWRASEF